MKIINDNLIDSVVKQAKESPRLRMNYNFHASLDDKCHRMPMLWNQEHKYLFITI